MLKDELKNILSGKAMPKAQKKAAANEYQEVKAEHDEIRKEMKLAKKAKDTQKLAELTKKLDTNLERELKLESTNKVEVRFRNTTIEVDRDYIKKLDNPDKYVNKLYFNKSVKQVEQLLDSERMSEAKGLVKLLKRSKETLETDDNKLDKIDEQLDMYKDILEDWGEDIDDIEPDDDDLYDAVYSSGGSSITVTVI